MFLKFLDEVKPYDIRKHEMTINACKTVGITIIVIKITTDRSQRVSHYFYLPKGLKGEKLVLMEKLARLWRNSTKSREIKEGFHVLSFRIADRTHKIEFWKVYTITKIKHQHCFGYNDNYVIIVMVIQDFYGLVDKNFPDF